MSIPGNSVLRRILAEVLAGPVPEMLAVAEQAELPDERIEIWRTRLVHEPPFATSLHFWSHALQAFLRGRGRADLFSAFAGHCLCESVDISVIPETFAALGRRVSPTLEIERNREYQVGYRMIEAGELVSWVAERESEFVALFWARTGWLARARPLPVDPIEFTPPA